MNSFGSIEEIFIPQNQKRNVPNDEDILMKRSGAGLLADEWEMLSENRIKSWLEDVDDTTLGELKKLIRYVRDISKQIQKKFCETIVEAMSRIVTNIVFIIEKWTLAEKYLNYGFCSCFKALIYLQNHGVDVRKDIPTILEFLKNPAAYCQIAMICSKYTHRCSGMVHQALAIIGNCPEMIKEENYEDLLGHLCDLADQKNEWKSKHDRDNWKLYGKSMLVDKKNGVISRDNKRTPNFSDSEDVQASPFSEEFMNILKFSSTHPSEIDPRKPMGKMSEENELISLILAKVSVVDKVLGVKRETEEWESLRELLFAYGVCDDSGEVFHERSINNPQKTYGQYRTDMYDILTPIGYFSSCFTAQSRGFLDYNDRNEFDEISQIDGATYEIKRTMNSGSKRAVIRKERVAFMLDITFRNEDEENVQYVMESNSVSLVGSGGALLHVEYFNSCIMDESQCDIWYELNSATKSIAEMYDADALSLDVLGYPSPRGIEAIAFTLQRPWKNWRGVGIARTTVVYDAICEIINKMTITTETMSDFDENTYSKWNGIEIEPEVIALSRGIRIAPSSIVLTLYLSAVCSLSPFDWERLSAAKSIIMGQPETKLLPTKIKIDEFIKENVEKSRRNCPDCGIIGPREGQLLIKSNLPWDLIILSIFIGILCLLPPLARDVSEWKDSLSEAIQNLGTGMAPVIVVYTLAIYQGWDVRDMMNRRKSCRTIRMAKSLCIVKNTTREGIVLSLKKDGYADDIFQTAGNSLALSGSKGFGVTWIETPLSAQKLMDSGSIFLKRETYSMGYGNSSETSIFHAKEKENETLGTIDVGGFLRLQFVRNYRKRNEDEEEKHFRVFEAIKSPMIPGVWRKLDRSEILDILIT